MAAACAAADAELHAVIAQIPARAPAAQSLCVGMLKCMRCPTPLDCRIEPAGRGEPHRSLTVMPRLLAGMKVT